MSKIIDETRALVDKIKKDQAYIDYMNFKTLIQSKSELKQKVDEFRNKSFQIQMSQNYGYYNAYEQLIKLTEENEQILSEPLVKEFLIAELKLSKLLSKIYNCIYEEIDFDISFLE